MARKTSKKPGLLKRFWKQTIIDSIELAEGASVKAVNDRTSAVDTKVIVGKNFLLDFDFHDLETAGIEGKIMNVRPGPLPKFDRTVGIQFTTIDPLVKRDLNRIVMRDKARGTA